MVPVKRNSGFCGLCLHVIYSIVLENAELNVSFLFPTVYEDILELVSKLFILKELFPSGNTY